VQFSGFQDDAKIQPISGKSAKNFRENRTFSENFRKSKIGKFRWKISEKVPKRRFWKIQPSFAERVLKHILRAKIDKKKNENLGTKNGVSNARNFPKSSKKAL
jgi:hypothetical protein